MSATSWPLIKTWNWPTPFSKSSRSNPAKVNVVFPGGTDLTLMMKLPELDAWLKSPLYEPVIMCRPVTVGVYVTLHVAIPGPLPAARVHDAEDGLNVPVL